MYFGTDAAFWMHLQVAWDMHVAVFVARLRATQEKVGSKASRPPLCVPARTAYRRACACAGADRAGGPRQLDFNGAKRKDGDAPVPLPHRARASGHAYRRADGARSSILDQHFRAYLEALSPGIVLMAGAP